MQCCRLSNSVTREPSSILDQHWAFIHGIPLSSFDPALMMTIDNCVDAILSGVAKGEKMILPSVEDYQLFQDYEQSRTKLFAATQTGKPASRYKQPSSN